MTRKERLEDQYAITCRDIAISRGKDYEYLVDHLHWIYREALSLYGFEYAESLRDKYEEMFY